MGVIHVAAWRSAYAGIMTDAYLAGLDPALVGQRWETTLAEGADGSTVMVVSSDDRLMAMCSFGPFRSRRGRHPRGAVRARSASVMNAGGRMVRIGPLRRLRD